MAEYISRQAAIEVIDAVFPVDSMKSEYAQGIACGAALAKTYIEQLLSAQPEQRYTEEELRVFQHGISLSLVRIVRCKDCIHRDPEDKKCDCGHGIVWQLPRDDNWFCADGKRRGE